MLTKDGNLVYRQFSRYIIERCVRKSIQTRLFKTKGEDYETEPIHRTSMWKFKLSAATMTLIPAAVGFNLAPKPWRRGLKLPAWLGLWEYSACWLGRLPCLKRCTKNEPRLAGA